jgi:phosphoglucosamine mutase
MMITASHNPPQYNGIKIFNSDSMAYDEEKQNEIERIIEHENYRLADWQNVGEAIFTDASHLYLKFVKKNIKLNKVWHVIVDPGCGATCQIAPALFKSLKCRVTPINAQPDGYFPSRSPEPNAGSLEALSKIVKELGADVGVAYDGDGDRAAFLDEKGNFVDFDQVLAAYAAYVVKKNRGGTIVTNVEASMCIERMVEQYGGKVVRTRVGDVYVAETLKQFKAFFGGEPCGAWIHPQFHYCPDGMLSSVLLLKALEDENKKMSEFIAETPRYQMLRKNIPCKNEIKYKVMEKVKEGLKSVFPEYKQLSMIDGVRLTLEGEWGLVRASGTEPLIRLTVEGRSVKTAENIIKKITAYIKELVGKMEK